MYINNFNQFINESNYIVYDDTYKVIGCDLTKDELEKIKKKAKNIFIEKQDDDFKSLKKAQEWINSKYNKEDKLIKSDNTVIKKLYQIYNIVHRRFPHLSRGSNPYFLELIGRIFKINRFIFITNVENSEHFNDVKYVLLLIDNKLYDCEGFHTIEDVMKKFDITEYTYKDFTFESDLNFLKEFERQKQLKSIPLERHEKEELESLIEQIKEL